MSTRLGNAGPKTGDRVARPIPCEKNKRLQTMVREYVETLKTEGHTIGTHGLDEKEFYNSGLFRGAIDRLRGQIVATMKEKRKFVTAVLNFMEDEGHIANWESAGAANRHDYVVKLPDGRTGVIELKGCMDGNNTVIYDRPPHAEEFIIWSVCINLAADPRKNAWSGIHTRIGADLIERQQRVDGVIIWDMVCGTVGRPCPKSRSNPERLTAVDQYLLPPPCIYVLPATVASPRNNASPAAQPLERVHLLKAFYNCFGGRPEEVNYVDFEAEHRGPDTVRRTRIRRGGAVVAESELIAIKRK